MTTSYLLRTKPQGEAKAIAGIKRAGADAWTPTEDRVKRAYRYSKKKRVVTVPLAAGYVIAGAGHRLVHDVNEVSGVVGNLTDRDVSQMRAMEGGKADTVLHKSLTIGQPIIVRDGPFRDHTSTISAIDGNNATITLSILGGPAPVTMPLSFLDPL